MIDWDIIVRLIDYNFDSIGTHSALDYEHPEYGELSFQWRANKSMLEITFVDTCHNCICEENDGPNCDCDWIGFKETEWKTKTFTKKEFINIKQQHKIDF